MWTWKSAFAMSGSVNGFGGTWSAFAPTASERDTWAHAGDATRARQAKRGATACGLLRPPMLPHTGGAPVA